MKRKILSSLLCLLLLFTSFPQILFASDEQTVVDSSQTIGTTDNGKKISVRWASNGAKSTEDVIVGGADQTEYGVPHKITVTPESGKYVVAGYFASSDYHETIETTGKLPAPFTGYSGMELEIVDTDPSTNSVTFQFTATEYFEVATDNDYNHI